MYHSKPVAINNLLTNTYAFEIFADLRQRILLDFFYDAEISRSSITAIRTDGLQVYVPAHNSGFSITVTWSKYLADKSLNQIHKN